MADPETNEKAICKLEDKVDDVGKDVKSILTNHLPHINTKIAVLMAQMVIVMAALAYLLFA